ncbi:MAG: hypothetical protein H0U27_08275 [Nitrosopumilus sp.]|nr:hypothetical protein [Nitrosopumilus sp.]
MEKFRRFIRKCYIINVKKALSDSRPCKRCLCTLKSYGIKRIYYSRFGDLKMEKIIDMTTEHLSSKYRRPWSEFNK